LTELVVHLKFFLRINTYLKLFTVLWLCASLLIPVKTQNFRPYMAAKLVNGLCNIVLTGWREATLEDKSVVPNSVRYHRITVVNTCVSGDSYRDVDDRLQMTCDKTVQAAETETVSIGRKEKSVLQAKLTKLAIQIGYGGTTLYS